MSTGKKLSLGLTPPKPSPKENAQAKEELERRIEQFVEEPEASPPRASSSPEAAASDSSTPTTVHTRASQSKDYRATVYLPLELHEILKAYCAAERTSISQLVTTLVQERLEEIGPIKDSASFMAAYYASKVKNA